jgi:hypothetical protein
MQYSLKRTVEVVFVLFTMSLNYFLHFQEDDQSEYESWTEHTIAYILLKYK